MQSYSICKASSQNDYSKEDKFSAENCKTYQNIHSEQVRWEMLKHLDFEQKGQKNYL